MKSKDNDILRNLGIGVIASLPYAGGTLAYVVDKNIPEQIELRYFSFIKALENDIQSMKTEIDYSRFETPEFYSVFVKVIHEIISNHLEEKRVVYKNILINTVDASWKCNKNDFFFSITKHLSLDAINYLFSIYLGIAQSSYKNISFSLNDLMKRFKFQSDYLATIVSELVRYNLIKGLELTEFGRQYCNFIFSPIQPHNVSISNQ